MLKVLETERCYSRVVVLPSARMDEAEKYKQRLEAIAEKRRLQEEQDKARREKEDERLRQQQLKRKSLRDQWLMEGSPLSPLSPNSQNTFSSLWGTHDQDMEEQNDKLQSSDQQATVQADHGMEAEKVFETRAEINHIVLENEDTIPFGSEKHADEDKRSQSPLQGENDVVLTNGGGRGEESNDHSSSGQNEDITAPFGVTEDPNNIRVEPELSVTVPACTQDPHANKNEEEEKGEDEDGTVVIRAEPVYITDDGSGDLSSLKNQQESTLNPEGVQEIIHAMEEVSETEGAPETSPELETVEAAELTVKAQPSSEDAGDMKGGSEPSSNTEPEGAAPEGQEEKPEDPDSPPSHLHTNTLEGATVAYVPTYAEAPLSPPAPQSAAETKHQAPAPPQEAEEAVNVEEPESKLGQFQEVQLTDPEPGEQEALLQKHQAPNLSAESAGSNSPVSSETQSPNKASQGEKSPKQKSCQCCSLM
ncbi:paralemmin-3 isoform X1 [Cyprinodon tularosa]|uniref:paralemmin-3 isoform X1 n=2 Tax=Cyprinodon tularosa TaxID=77115 RepID=UPI0018E25898|nr:paralemmin-3 isoform X1 [Cyprinodon tularosa]